MNTKMKSGSGGWIADLVDRLSRKTPLRDGAEPAIRPEPHSSDVIYAIGDVHGRLDLLRQLEALIGEDLQRLGAVRSTLVMLGDFIDRGPDSCGVIEHLSTRPKLCPHEVFLRGNHEQVLLDFLDTADVLEAWSHFGGLETLYSYGLKPPLQLSPEAQEDLRLGLHAALPPHHLAFFVATRLSFETATHFFAHAGVNPKASLTLQQAADLLWIRDDFLASTRRLEKVIVHGHTPRDTPEILRHRIGIDTGAYATGRLTCAAIMGATCRIIST